VLADPPTHEHCCGLALRVGDRVHLRKLVVCEPHD
jgi:hypothetical protein